MRLLDTHTGKFVDKNPKTTTYAILSHTWGESEQTYQEIREIQAFYADDRSARRPNTEDPGRSIALDAPSEGSSQPPDVVFIWDDPRLSAKVRDACALARKEGYDYLWIDSCCIDKTSSSELTEAINSMYKWYASAAVCYAFLADVPADEDHHAEVSRFRQSRWFTRGWTLQELIAPNDVVFLSQDWKVIGSKHDLVELIEDVTGISGEALLHELSLDEFSVAQRLSWASLRQTTREEDEAYSLLGIFNINMPTVYGEGKAAFRRLQEEIIRRIPDQSIFAWGDLYLGPENLQEPVIATSERGYRHLEGSSPVYSVSGVRQSFLASSPDEFDTCGSIKAVSYYDVFRRLQLSHLPAIEYMSTPHGIRTQVPISPNHEPDDHWPSLFPLSPATIERCRSAIVLKTVYISHPDREDWALEAARRQPHQAISLTLLRKSREALRAQGYTAELRGPDQDHPTTHELTLSNDDHTIVIKCQHILRRDGHKLIIKADVQMVQPVLDSGEGDPPALPDPGTVPVGHLQWTNSMIWSSSLRKKKVALTAPVASTAVMVSTGFHLAGPSRYFLVVDVLSDTTAAAATIPPPPIDVEPGEEQGLSSFSVGDA